MRRRPVIYVHLAPEASSFNASFALCRRLAKIGYEMIYIGPPEWRDFVLKNAFGYSTFEPYPSITENPKNDEGFWVRWRRRRRRLKRERDTCSHALRALEAELRDARPVLFLINPLIMEWSLPPLRCNIPVITLNTTLASTFSLDLPPVFENLAPSDAVGWRERWRNAVAWGRCLGSAWGYAFFWNKIVPLAHGLAPHRSPIRSVRALGHKVRLGEYGPCLDALEFVLSPRELDFPQSADARKRVYVGACVDLAREQLAFDWSDLSDDKALIYCSLGTYSAAYPHARRLFAAVLEAVERRENLQAVIQLGDAAQAVEFGRISPRIRLVHEAPQLEVLRRSAFFITHGGFSSVREAMLFGVPVAVFPCWLDQAGNAARIRLKNLGVDGDIACVTSATIAEMLEELRSERIQSAVRRMRDAFENQIDCDNGIECIQSLLENHRGAESGPLSLPRPRRGDKRH